MHQLPSASSGGSSDELASPGELSASLDEASPKTDTARDHGASDPTPAALSPDDEDGDGDELERPESVRITTPWSPYRPVDVERVEQIAELLARWELGAIHRLRAAAHRAVASEPEYLVLSELAVRPRGLTGAALAGIVGIGSGGVSGVLARLEEQELVERARDPDDGRGRVAFVTDAGREFVRDKVGDVSDLRGVADLVAGMRADQLDLIAEFLGLATNRAYRQSRRLRDHPRRRR